MDSNKARFRSAEIALRFFFRVRELLHSGRAGRLLPRELPAAAKFTASSAIDDYRNIGWCMRGLGEVDLWLLSELYGPTSFGVRRRTYSQAYEAGRLEFPQFGLRLRQIAILHEHAIEIVVVHLRELGMIPADNTPAEVRTRRRSRAQEKRSIHQSAQLSQ